MPKFKGAFAHCSWCHGNGCSQCDAEREKYHDQPLLTFTAEDLQGPTLGGLINKAVGREAVEKAFAHGGGGMDEIRDRCATASLVQAIERQFGGNTEAAKGAKDG